MLHSKRLDQIAIALSAVCIVHCMAVPVAVAVLPIAAVTIGSGTHFHALMLWLVVPTSLVGFSLGFRIHGKPGIVALGATGLTGIAVAALWGHANWPLAAEIGFSIVSSLILGTAHYRNFLEVRHCHLHG